MFAIHAPQSISLKADGDEEDTALVNFSLNGADTSRCKLEIISKGRVWTAIFNQRGYLIDQSYKGPDAKDAPEVQPLSASDYMVDGRDTRSDNPYTHVAPPTMDSAYVAPAAAPLLPVSKETRAIAEKAHKDAAGRAEDVRKQRAKEASEKPEDRAKRLEKERQERLKKANLASGEGAEAHVEQTGEPERAADGSLRQTPPEPSRDPGHYDPLVPAASSPMPGSPPPHRIDSANPTQSTVNTTQTLNEPAYRP